MLKVDSSKQVVPVLEYSAALAELSPPANPWEAVGGSQGRQAPKAALSLEAGGQQPGHGCPQAVPVAAGLTCWQMKLDKECGDFI